MAHVFLDSRLLEGALLGDVETAIQCAEGALDPIKLPLTSDPVLPWRCALLLLVLVLRLIPNLRSLSLRQVAPRKRMAQQIYRMITYELLLASYPGLKIAPPEWLTRALPETIKSLTLLRGE
jgi:hypothetical protein